MPSNSSARSFYVCQSNPAATHNCLHIERIIRQRMYFTVQKHLSIKLSTNEILFLKYYFFPRDISQDTIQHEEHTLSIQQTQCIKLVCVHVEFVLNSVRAM